jgi:PAT family beta-lactamase induction signal transducer AmpG
MEGRDAPETSPWQRWARIARRLTRKRMAVALLMGFSSGLPLLLTSTLLQAWLTRRGYPLGLIGLVALVGLPYSFKFLWAPFLDRFEISPLGRRRSWLLVTQLLLVAAIVALGLVGPRYGFVPIAAVAFAVCFFSASQDTVIDAYRRESLSEDEQAFGASLYVNGYRVAMLVASGGGLILSHFVGFRTTYFLMAAGMGVGILTTFWADEPPSRDPGRGWRALVLEPLRSYFAQEDALLVLLFVVIYKVGDLTASNMTIPFYLRLGYSRESIGLVVKLFGYWAIVAGGLLGGVASLRIGLYRTLFWFGLLQACATASYAWLTVTGPSIGWLAAVISLENLSLGMSTAAFVGFLAVMTDRRFTATQFALLTSLMAVPRVLLSSPAGYLAGAVGWAPFFLICAAMAAPGLILVRRFRGWLERRTGTTATAETLLAAAGETES